MTFPKQIFNIQDPGLSQIDTSDDTPVMSGVSTGGSVAAGVLTQINSIADVRSLIGYGPLAEDVALALSKRGGPINFILHNSADSKVLTAQALTLVGTGPAITVSGTPNDVYALRVEVLVGGVIGTSQFRYSLDAFDANYAPYTYSQTRATVASYVMQNTGLTLAMPAGTYVQGDVYTFLCLPKDVLSADLAAVGLVLQNTPALDFKLWSVSGTQATAANGATIAAAFQGQLNSLLATFRFARGIIDVGSVDTSANVNTSAAGWTGSRVSPAYGYTLRSSLLPYEGFSVRKTSMVSGEAARAFGEKPSSDLSRIASGADDGVLKIYFDGNYDQSLDTSKVSTMRTWPGLPGFYFTNAKLHSSFGSDYTDLQYGRVMDIACRTTYEAQLPYVSAEFRTVTAANAKPSSPLGAVDPRDASQMEANVQTALNAKLKTPLNARGLPGYVTDVFYQVDRTANLVQTQQLKTSVGVVPLGYAKIISTNLFMTVGA